MRHRALAGRYSAHLGLRSLTCQRRKKRRETTSGQDFAQSSCHIPKSLRNPGGYRGLGHLLKLRSNGRSRFRGRLSLSLRKKSRGAASSNTTAARGLSCLLTAFVYISESDQVPERFASASEILDFGPGCRVMRVFPTEDPNIVLYWISIWNTLNLRVKIDLETELVRLDRQSRRAGGIIPPDNRAMQVSKYLRSVDPLDAVE
jgi:hypothetical protein